MPRLISVSIVAAPCLRFAHAARWNGQAPHSTTGVAELQRQPLPVVELQRRDHRHQQHRQDSSAETISRVRSGAVGVRLGRLAGAGSARGSDAP